MARIKHIAIRTIDPQKTALFYKEVFGLKEVGLGLNGIYLSDGHLNVAILKAEPSGKLGIDHFGFHVEDVEKTLERLGQLGGKALTEHRNVNPNDPSQPQSYYEIKCAGPDGQVIDISSAGWVGAA